MILHLARLLTGPKTTQMRSENKHSQRCNQLLCLCTRGCFTCPPPRTGRGRKEETQALNTDTLRLVSSWHRHANASEKHCWGRRRTAYNFPPPSVSKWYYLLRHRLPNFVLLAAPKPSIRSPIGQRICDVSASVTHDFEQPHSGHPQDTDWTELRYTLKRCLLMLHGITFASAKA